jgi:hypothetical protein
MRKRTPPIDRVLRRVVMGPDGCWIFTGSKDKLGYGRATTGSRADGTKRPVLTHRVTYEHFTGLIPDGLELDHLCRTPACCNPAHLEPVTHRENLLRGNGVGAINAAKTQCPHGHAYSPENTAIWADGQRRCLTCRRARQRAAYLKRTHGKTSVSGS